MMNANANKGGRGKAFVELIACQLGLIFIIVGCYKCFAAPNELLKETGFDALPEYWQVVLGRVFLVFGIFMGLFFSIRSILNFFGITKFGNWYGKPTQSPPKNPKWINNND